MPATFVTVAQLRLNLGIGTLYTDALLENVCQASEDIIKEKLWFNRYNIIAHENELTVGILYTDREHDIYVGQTVKIEGAGQKFNGNKVVTAIDKFSFTVTTTHTDSAPKHNNYPYGSVFLTQYVDYEDVPAVKEAAMMIAVDIFQARQMSSTGGISPDFQPSPYRMGNSLTSRVRGLLADYLAPGGLVG